MTRCAPYAGALAFAAGASAYVEELSWVGYLVLVILVFSLTDLVVQLRKKKRERVAAAANVQAESLRERAIRENDVELSGDGITPAGKMMALTELVAALHTAPLPSLKVYTAVMREINAPDPLLCNMLTLTRDLLEPDYVEVPQTDEPDYLLDMTRDLAFGTGRTPDRTVTTVSEEGTTVTTTSADGRVVRVDSHTGGLCIVDLEDVPRGDDRYPPAFVAYEGAPRRWRWPNSNGSPNVADGYIARKIGQETDPILGPVTIWQETFLHRR